MHAAHHAGDGVRVRRKDAARFGAGFTAHGVGDRGGFRRAVVVVVGDGEREGEEGFLVAPQEVLHVDAGGTVAVVQAAQQSAGAGFQGQGGVTSPESLDVTARGAFDGQEPAAEPGGVPGQGLSGFDQGRMGRLALEAAFVGMAQGGGVEGVFQEGEREAEPGVLGVLRV